MIKKTNIALALATVSVVALGAVAANAAESVTPTATVTVLNAFTLTSTTALNFGTISATGDGAATGVAATYAIAADGSPTITNAGAAADDFIVSVVPGTQAVIDITDAAPNTIMTVTEPQAATTLTCGLCPSAPNVLTFDVDTWVDDTTGGPGGTVTTDGTGAATINMGATLTTTPDDSSDIYEDGVYTGTYTVTVAY